MIRIRTAVLALTGVLAAGVASAGESEMLAPLPSLNVWSAGKTSFTIWGGLGKTGIGDGAKIVTLDEDGYPDLGPADAYVLYDEDSGHYDDRDWSLGGRFGFAVGNALTLEVGARYLSGDTDTDSYSVDSDIAKQVYRVNVHQDESKTTDYGLSFSALYVLASGAASPIRGGLYGSVEAGRRKVEQDFSLDTQDFDINIPGFGTGASLAGSTTSWNATTVTIRVGITGDIHIVPETFRITPSIGYYYSFTSIKDNSQFAYAISDLGGVEPVVEELSTDSDRGGGPSYGVELGYRPGGENGKFEIVLTPVYKGRRVRLVTGEKLDDHRNAIILQFRMFL